MQRSFSCRGKAMVAYTKPQQGKKVKGLTGEGDQTKF